MIEPFTALGAASSIVQFVDFGSKLLIEGYGLYKSKEGATKEHLNVEELTTETMALMSRLLALGDNSSDVALQRLALRCRSLAHELLQMLKELKVDPNAPFRTWEAVRKALRQIKKTSKIEKMRKELDRIHVEINTLLLSMLNTSLATTYSNLQNENNKHHLNNAETLTAAKKELIDAIHSQDQQVKELSKAAKKSEQARLAAARSLDTSLTNLELRIDEMLREGSKVATAHSILRSLLFPAMSHRHTQIEEAYPETFKWIFDNTAAPFKDWLETQSGVFWINGKAGSGKSTLMKYLNNHEQTQRSLQAWAAKQRRQLHVASFYFWNSGTLEQNSQEGLLKSLLYQILRQCPQLIPFASERRWKVAKHYFEGEQEDTWSRSELSNAFKMIISRSIEDFTSCFCFFIDGLDEYGGDHFLLIQDLDRLTASECVKLCVSSRPWTVFRNRYGDETTKLLVLQELTQPDMDKFVKGRLEEDLRFKRLAKSNPRAGYLITEIRKRAEGVFLWVFLVVRSLLRGMSENDDFDTLEKRLNELPTDLEAFFQHILNRVESVYRDPMARMLLLAVHCVIMPLEAVYYLVEDAHDPDHALKAEIREATSAELAKMKVESTERLHAWCKDLLEVHSLRDAASKPWYRVTCLHRTVRDFLVTPDMQTTLCSLTVPAFSPWLTLVRVHLRRAKLLGDFTKTGSEQFEEIVWGFLWCAKQYEVFSQATPAEHLLELDRVGRVSFDGPCHWSGQILMHSFASLNISGLPNALNFTPLAVNFELEIFVREHLQIDAAALKGEPGWPLLHFALHTGLSPYQSCRNMVQMLLAEGADPNELGPRTRWIEDILGAENHQQTVWTLFLYRIYHDGLGGTVDTDSWPIARLMLEHGADPNVQIEVRSREGRSGGLRTVSECLKSAYEQSSNDNSAELEHVIAQVSTWVSPNWRTRLLSNLKRLAGFSRVR